MDSDEEESINGQAMEKGECLYILDERGGWGVSMKRRSTRPHYCLLEHTPEWEGGQGRESEGSFQTPPSNLTFNFLGSTLDGRHFCAA